MKYLIFLLSLCVLLCFSCKKDENTFDKLLLQGKWEEISIEWQPSCIEYIEFTDEHYKWHMRCESRTSNSSSKDYVLDGKWIFISDGHSTKTWEILYLSATYMKLRKHRNNKMEMVEYRKP